jgi:hypothetical protein
MKQNITLSLDKEVIRKSKILAAREDTAISKLPADSIERAGEDADFYEAASFHLGGARRWKREDLYDR